MLHELLLALSGYPGGIFVKGANNEVKVAGDLPFIHPSELCLLNRLCKLSTHYVHFNQFIQCQGSSGASGNGLYVRAVCRGLVEVMQPYRNTLLQLEAQVLADQNLTAAHIQTELEQYQLMFPAISSVLEQIKLQKAHGCQFLEIIYEAAASGIPIVKAALMKVLWHCHGVLYKQLAGWMLHGQLLDHHDEFFIYRELRPVLSGVTTVEEDDLGLGGVTGRQLKQIMTIHEGLPSSTHYEQYSLRGEMLPSYIPTRVADKIIFIGESIKMFEQKQTTLQQAIQGSILKNREDEFAKQLQVLAKESEFSLMSFENVIDRIRACVAEQLWQLIMEEADLMGQLRIMKDMFLLGRGELFLAFIDQSGSLLKMCPTATTEHDINVALQQSARNILLEDEGMMQKFTLHVDKPQHELDKEQTKDSGVDREGAVTFSSGWSLLSLNCAVDWPLHIIFTPAVLERYNQLFRFLLLVKRVQLQLQHCWALQMHHKHLQTDQLSSSRWWLRNHMAFLVDNLQYYLQVDVIESQFGLLQERVQNTRDFEAIRLAHDNFLACLLSQAFLLMKPVSHCLMEIFELCQSFCALLGQEETVMTEQEVSQVQFITKSFQRQSSLLFKILSSVSSHQASPHLAQLLLRIDFNKYFTMAGGQLGSKYIPANTRCSTIIAGPTLYQHWLNVSCLDVSEMPTSKIWAEETPF